MTKRSSSSVFDAIHQLDRQDSQNASRKRRATERDIQRARAAKSQVRLHAQLLEFRILLQRVLVLAKNEHDNDDSKAAAKTRCEKLTGQLQKALSILTDPPSMSTTVTKDKKKDKKATAVDKDGTDVGVDDATQYASLKAEWMAVLNRRQKDLRLHAGLTAKSSFRVMDSSFWEQVESTASHDRLRRQVGAGTDNATGATKPTSTVLDDSKLYQNMLQDFLRTQQQQQNADGNGNSSSHHLQRSNRNAPKKLVDRKASKGRKLRYATLPKLVNFTFPVARDTSKLAMDPDEWFQSLFGGRK